jgi:hypothetical protein
MFFIIVAVLFLRVAWPGVGHSMRHYARYGAIAAPIYALHKNCQHFMLRRNMRHFGRRFAQLVTTAVTTSVNRAVIGHA